MLSYFSEFPIKTSNANDVELCIINWLKGSPHRSLRDEDLDGIVSGLIEEIERENQSFSVIRLDDSSGKIFGAKHVTVDRSVKYYTTIVARNRDDVTWISVATGRAALSPQISLREAKKPQIIKYLLNTIGGGLDGELWVLDLPRLLSSSDIGMASRLINGDSSNHLPIVYVSRDFNNDILIDVISLAAHLGGLAHVIVEPSREFSRQIKSLTNSNNAYGGAVGVYLPTGRRSLVLPDYKSEWEFRIEITRIVRDALLTRLPISGFSWVDLEAERSRNIIHELRSAGSTDLDAFVSAFDAENKALLAQNEAQKNEIDKLKNELQSVNGLIRGKKSKSALADSVQSFFQGESEHILKETLDHAINSIQISNRRKMILQEISDILTYSNDFIERRDKVKAILSKYEKLDGKTKKSLEALGFSITSEGKHHKLVYYGDDRLVFVMAKTPSDWRAGKNFASEVVKKIF
jgi:hypothetical protein